MSDKLDIQYLQSIWAKVVTMEKTIKKIKEDAHETNNRIEIVQEQVVNAKDTIKQVEHKTISAGDMALGLFALAVILCGAFAVSNMIQSAEIDEKRIDLYLDIRDLIFTGTEPLPEPRTEQLPGRTCIEVTEDMSFKLGSKVKYYGLAC